MKIGLYGGMEQDITPILLEEILSLGVDCRLIPEGMQDMMLEMDVVYMTPHIDLINERELSKKVPIINSYAAMMRALDKIATSKILAQSDISQPDFLLADNLEDIQRFLLSHPVSIIKFPRGSAGFGHTIIVPEEEKIVGYCKGGKCEVVSEGDHISAGTMKYFPPYLVQEFISAGGNHKNDRVYRIYVVGNDVLFGTLRINGARDLSESIVNIARGARYEFIQEPDKQMQDLALRAARAIGFDIGVVDLLKDVHGNSLVIECDCDGRYMMADRKFMDHPEYCGKYNFNKKIGLRLIDIASGKEFRR